MLRKARGELRDRVSEGLRGDIKNFVKNLPENRRWNAAFGRGLFKMPRRDGVDDVVAHRADRHRELHFIEADLAGIGVRLRCVGEPAVPGVFLASLTAAIALGGTRIHLL